MAERIVIDPITRIEGHLKLEVEIDNGEVKDAWTSGTLFRGFEIMLKDRDPRDAWHLTQRICGVCPTSHAHASAQCLDDAFGVTIPTNGRIIRNIVEGAQFVHSHILWFYHLAALDYVDVPSALSAKTSDPELLAVQARLKTFVDSGQLGPFANGYWGHPAYKLPPEVNLLAVSHYLEALEMQAKAAHLSAILGGKMPMTMTSPPGGSSHVPTVDEITQLVFRLTELQDFIDNKFIPDVLTVAPYYIKEGYAGIGMGHGNYLSWGVFEDSSLDPNKRFLPRGALFADTGLELHDVAPEDVTEDTSRAWYNGDTPLNPTEGVTDPNYTGYDTDDRYTWAKAPRLKGKPMEVGALSRMLVAYASGQPTARALIDDTLVKIGATGKPEVLFSVIGRIAARALECKMIADEMTNWVLELGGNIKAGDTKVFEDHEVPQSGKGIGLWEAPRGSLGHWIDIENQKINNYQCVVPTTWNVCPRDGDGVRGPIEEALVGTPVADASRPIEILRVVHSFDPCLACTVHVIDPQTNEIRKFRVS